MHIQNVLPVIGHQWLRVARSQNRLPPHIFESTTYLRYSHGYDLNRQRESAQNIHPFALVDDTHKLLGLGCDDFFAGQRSTPAFDHIAMAIDFISAINVHRQGLNFRQIHDLDTMGLHTLGRSHGTGDSTFNGNSALGQSINKEIHRRTRTYANPRMGLHISQSRLGNLRFQYILAGELAHR